MNNTTCSFFTSSKKLFKMHFIVFCLFLISSLSFGQIAISSSTPVTQNFTIGATATASLPSGWRVSSAGNSSPTWSGSSIVATTQQASSGSPTAGGIYNWGNGTTTTDRAIGFMTSGGYASPNSIMAFYTNTSGLQINDLAISFDYERYRINTAACEITFFTSTDGTTWTARTAGDSGEFTTGTSAYNFTTGTVVSRSFTLSGVNIPAGGNIYFRWNFNTTGTNSQGVGLDNVSVTATLASAAVPVVTGATVNGTVGTALTNYQIVATNSPTSYAVSSGTLPAGLTLNTTSGVISGTPTTAGSSSVQVTATNGSGTSTPATLDFVIALGNQTITFNALANRQYGDANFNLTATASSGLTVDYESSNPLVATVSGNTVTIVGEGTTDITASQDGNANYNAAANVVRTLTITKRQLTVGGLTGENKVYDATTTASAIGTATLTNVLAGDESNVSLSGTPSYAFVTGTVGINKTINGSGFTLSGSAAGNYVLTQPTLTANVTVKAITVTGASANNKVYDGTTTATIVGGTLNGVEATDVANVTLVSAGSFDTATVGENKPVTLSISGSAAFNYSLTQPGITANITKADQTINFTALPVLNTNSGNVPLVATATSGLVVEFESSNPSVVTVSGNTLTVVGAGTAVITASQAGNTNYNPAVDVTQNVTVNLAPAIIAGWDFSPITTSSSFGDSPYSATTSNPNVTVVGLTRGSGVTTSGSPAANAWGGNGWDTTTSSATAITNNDFVTFSITTNAGYTSSFETVEPYNVRRTSTGPTTGLWQYQVNSDGFVTIGSEITWGGNTAAAGNAQSAIDLSAISALQDLPPNTIVTFRILNYSASAPGGNWYLNGQGGSTAALDFTITGYVSPFVITEVTWSGTEWSNIAGPDETIDAILVGPYNTTANTGFTAKSLTVTTGGSLTIGAGTSVTVVNELNNELTAAAVVINSDGSLIQQGTTNTNSGNVTVFRNSQDLMRLDYTMWSSPVAAQNLGGFSPFTMTNRFYTYNTATDVYATTANTYNFAVGQGYLIRTPDNHPTSPTSWLGQFVGLPNSGDVTVGLSTAGQGFNLVGNPYPSPISISTMISENNGVIGGNLYFWRKTNGATGSAYITYSGGTFSDGPHDFNNIQPGQGFIVEAVSGAGLSFTNTQRQADNGVFYRNGNAIQSEDNSRIWLNVSANNAVVGQMAIGYNASASNDLDPSDAAYINDNAVALNSFVANTELAVQHRAEFVATDVVPLSFKTNIAGSYTIAINDVDGLFTNEAQTIFLKDNLLNIEHDLRNSAYQFTSASGVFANRFEVIYQSTLGVTLPEFANQTIVFAKDNNLNVQSGSSVIKGIQVFDVQGRLVLDVKDINATSYSASLEQISNGVLLVKVFADNGMCTTKKIIK